MPDPISVEKVLSTLADRHNEFLYRDDRGWVICSEEPRRRSSSKKRYPSVGEALTARLQQMEEDLTEKKREAEREVSHLRRSVAQIKRLKSFDRPSCEQISDSLDSMARLNHYLWFDSKKGWNLAESHSTRYEPLLSGHPGKGHPTIREAIAACVAELKYRAQLKGRAASRQVAKAEEVEAGAKQLEDQLASLEA